MVNVPETGVGFEAPEAWKDTFTTASSSVGLKNRPSVRKNVEFRPFARATPFTTTS